MLLAGPLSALLVALALATAPPAAQNRPLQTFYGTDWSAHRKAILSDPSLLRYYTFENFRPEALVRGTLGGELTYRAAPWNGQPGDTPQAIEGMWPGKTAARLDRGAFQGEPFALAGKSFTVEVWMRKNGQGSIPGDQQSQSGTLISMGGGYWDGFRITTSYPAKTLGFEIGRPQPGSGIGLWDAGPLPDGVWNHVAATWDGKEMRLYLNGILAGSRPYDGSFTPPRAGDKLRIGFNAMGWGSTRLDVDEVAVYGLALSSTEIASHALLATTYAPELAAASEAYILHDYRNSAARSRSLLGRLSRLDSLRSVSTIFPAPHANLKYDPSNYPVNPGDSAALAALQLSRALIKLGDAAGAGRELAAVSGAGDVSDRYRATAVLDLFNLNRAQEGAVPPDALRKLTADPTLSAEERFTLRLSLARADRRAGRFDLAEKEYGALMSDPSTPAATQADLRLEEAHALRQRGDYAGARAAYAAMAGDAALRFDLRDYAGLLAAGCLASSGKWAEARAAYRALLESNAPTLSRRLEIEERLREIDRLAAGRPAHDPEESRRRIPAAPKPGAELFVAPNGSDSASGDPAHPLASFAGAVKAVRALKARGGLPAGGVAVIFRAGEYRLSETVKLGAEDGGSEGSPIVYRAAPGQAVRFTGGVRLRGFEPVTDAAVLARLPEEARGKVVRIDLRSHGVTDFGRLFPRGMSGGSHPVTELFFNGKAMQLARWPKTGWLQTGHVSRDGLPEGQAAFDYAGDRPSRWLNATDVWLFGYPKYLWADAGLPVAGIDPATHTIRLDLGNTYGIAAGMPYYVYNLLEELNAPGEWYLDRANGILYLYPPSDPNAADLQLSMLSEPFVEADGVSYLHLEHLTFELGRLDGIVVRNGEHCLIAGCTVRRLGGLGISIDGGRDDGIFGCDIYSLGCGATSIKGGDRKTLTPSGHFVENCHIYDFSRWSRTYTPAVYTEGVGMRIAHNLIHDTPGHAMRLEGNDQVVEYNDVHHAVQETDDQGAVDIFANISYRGIVLRYNFWHFMGDGADRLMHAGIRLDDAISGVTIFGNVFYRSAEGLFGGVQIHGGKDNVVENNLFVRCKYGVSFSQWGADRWKRYISQSGAVGTTMGAVDITQPPYSTRYPDLGHLLENIDVNKIWRNVAVSCGSFLARDGNRENMFDNMVTVEDPAFVTLRNGAFGLNFKSGAFGQTGFRPIPFGEIGLYADPLRASWPVDNRFTDHY
jgi:hypothetical protein